MRRAGRVLAAVALCAGCSTAVEPGSPWVPAAEIAGPLAPEIMGEPPPVTRSGRHVSLNPLRVVTFNVERGDDVAAIAAALLGHPDLSSAGLLLLQEEEGHPGEGGSRAARLADALGMAHAYIPARLMGDGTHGLAILSAYPIDDVQTMRLPATDIPLTGAARIAVSADILVGSTRLHVINVHLDTLLNATDRILQLRPAVIDAPDTVLVAGDFNTNDYVWAGGTVPVLPVDAVADADQAPVLDDYMADLGFETPTASLGVTEHRLGAEFRLDSIYTRGLSVVPGAVAREVDVSDHWPVWVDVTIP
jgi:endonuclease/exonuclease/phosphatase family metal-dependent hydrolase